MRTTSIGGRKTKFTDYRIIDSGQITSGPPEEWPRSVAQKDFDYFMANRDARIAMLDELTTRNDGPRLDFTDESVAALNEWFVDRAEPEPDQQTWPGGLTAEWYSVVGDVRTYLGEILRRRQPHLEWRLSTQGKRNLNHHRPVITGFTNVPYEAYSVEYARIVAILGVRIVKDELRDDSRRILLDNLLRDVESA